MITKAILVLVTALLIIDFRTRGYRRYHMMLGFYLVQLEHWWEPNNFLCSALPFGLVVGLGFWSLAIENLEDL